MMLRSVVYRNATYRLVLKNSIIFVVRIASDVPYGRGARRQNRRLTSYKTIDVPYLNG